MVGRVSFYTHSAASLESMIIAEYTNFRKWVLETDPWCFRDKSELKKAPQSLMDFIWNNKVIQSFENFSQILIDQLTGNFVEDYCKKGPGKKLLHYLGPLENIPEFKQDLSSITQDNILMLCQFILHGRTIKEKYDYFYPIDLGILKVGYWTSEEKIQLSDALKEICKSNSETPGIAAICQILKESKCIEGDLLFTVA